MIEPTIKFIKPCYACCQLAYLKNLKRSKIASASWYNNGAIIIAKDIDDKDIKGTHFFGQDGSDLIAYLRVTEAGVLYPNHISIGRVVIKKTHRNKKLGNEILANAIDFCRKKFPKTPIKISAQTHLKSFYNQLGFEFKGEAYLEDGIPHCAMYLGE